MELHSPIFSVIIPTYNRGRVIERAVQSVMSQTFNDFEIIIVDDGSVDDTRRILSSITDERLRCIFQENGGAPNARNRGIDEARGRYAAFLDSDDEFLPGHLANALPVLEQGTNYCTYTQIITDRGDGVTFLKPPRALRADEDIADYYLCDRGFIQTSTLIVPVLLAMEVKYDERMTAGNDVEFSIRLVRAGAKLIMLDSPGAVWHDTGVPDRLSSRDNLEERLAWLERIRTDISDRAYYGELGWRSAKKYSRRGRKMHALSLYARALSKKCYSRKLAISIFFQILLSPTQYRKLSDILAKFGIKP